MCVGLLGVAYFAGVHSLVYFVVFQLLAGMLSVSLTVTCRYVAMVITSA